MSKQQKLFTTLIALILCISFSSIISAETLIYKETTSGKDLNINITINKSENEYVVKTTNDVNKDEMTYNTDQSFSIIRWKYYNPDNGTDVTLERSGNVISITGQLKNKKCEKKLEIDDLPWYQDWGLGLKSFINSDKNSICFWGMNPEDLKIYKYEVKKEKTETIEIKSNKVDSVYAKITFTGFMKMFWSADMWFRKSDGTFILSKMTKGPGTPVSTMQLMEEK